MAKGRGPWQPLGVDLAQNSWLRIRWTRGRTETASEAPAFVPTGTAGGRSGSVRDDSEGPLSIPALGGNMTPWGSMGVL